MCRARTGPRCSNSGRIRRDRADRHLEKVQNKFDAEKSNGKVSARTEKQLKNARLRKDAALRVWEATPKGHEEIAGNIDQLRHQVTKLPVGAKGSRESRNLNKAKRDLNNAEVRLAAGIKSRKDQYEGYHLTETERRALREYAQAQGAGINKRAQPASTQEDMDKALAHNKAAALELKQWPDEYYDRAANNWVEKGSKTPWEENINVRPPKGGEGERVVAPTSKAVRLNMPDGQIVESRCDVHVTKGTDGKYRVSERITVASSWEDAAPIDVTTQEVGHIIASKRGVNRKPHQEITEFNSEKEAVAHAAKIRRSVNQTLVVTSAKLGREAFIGRAQKSHIPLMNRGFVIYPRYKAA